MVLTMDVSMYMSQPKQSLLSPYISLGEQAITYTYFKALRRMHGGIISLYTAFSFEICSCGNPDNSDFLSWSLCPELMRFYCGIK